MTLQKQWNKQLKGTTDIRDRGVGEGKGVRTKRNKVELMYFVEEMNPFKFWVCARRAIWSNDDFNIKNLKGNT